MPSARIYEWKTLGKKEYTKRNGKEEAMAIRKMNKRKRAEQFQSIKSVLLIVFALASIALMFHTRVKEINTKVAINSEKIQALEKELQREEARNAELEQQRLYVQTDQYIIEMARKKLGLVFADEIIIKPE